MNEGTISLPWLVIRQDDNGNRYRVGRYATRAEAQKIADSLDSRGHKQLYWVERIGQGRPQSQTQSGDGTRN
ncbi:SPOR domain-containing protein [Streptomyces sp. T028]|uniref:SPOR domain-containing protein n=1 Tax=Streptomyces sp. T028 TaxID=3394379 RepID=UPI003A874AB8